MLKFFVRSIIWVSFFLTTLGLIILFYAGKSQSSTAYHFVTQQAIFFGIGLLGAFLISHIDYHFFRKPAVYWTIVGIMLFSLLMVLVPGVGKSVKGSHRWIGLGSLNVQPIEFVKLLMIVFLAGYLDVKDGLIHRFFRGFLPPILVMSAVVVLLLAQPDFGGAMIVCFLGGVSLIVGGAGIKKCLGLGAVAMLVIGVFLLLNSNRLARLKNDHEGENYQAKQSEIAFSNGQITGVGLGRGMQKERYLPECHTDFILAIVGEDLGLVATGGVAIAFIYFLICGVVIAFHAHDRQGMVLAFGTTLMITVQAAANIAVVTHIFPTKGLALPFLSYGGSCLWATYGAVGFLWAVGRNAITEDAESANPAQRLMSFD